MLRLFASCALCMALCMPLANADPLRKAPKSLISWEDISLLRYWVRFHYCTDGANRGARYTVGENEYLRAELNVSCNRSYKDDGGEELVLSARMTILSPLGKPHLFVVDKGIDGCVNGRGGMVLRKHDQPPFSGEERTAANSFYGYAGYMTPVRPCFHTPDYWQWAYEDFMKRLVMPMVREGVREIEAELKRRAAVWEFFEG